MYNLSVLLVVISFSSSLFARDLIVNGRVQGLAEKKSDSIDFYLRRVRVNTLFKLSENKSIYFDIRSDNVNRNEKANDGFELGDAYYKIETPHLFFNNITFFRAKVDVSYSQTSSSKHLLQPERALVSEYAANYIIHNRRSANVQINGHLKNLSYQLAVADGAEAKDLVDYGENEANAIEKQSLSYGAKLRYYFISDAKENKVQDTFYGERDTLSIGLGHFRNDNIRYIYLNDENDIRRSLTNIEFSYAYKSLRFLGEYFHFTGDLKDIANNQQSSANGHYFQSEYVFNTYDEKWAPFFLYQVFSRSTHRVSGVGYGVNFYPDNASFRYGLSYNKIQNQEKISLYTFLDF